MWSPEQSGVYLGSPSIVRLDERTLLASHDTFGGGTSERVYVYRSRDEGASWDFLSTVKRQYWSQMFTRWEAGVHAPLALYLLGTSGSGEGKRGQVSAVATMTLFDISVRDLAKV